MEQENPFLESDAKYDAVYAATIDTAVAEFLSIGGEKPDNTMGPLNNDGDMIRAQHISSTLEIMRMINSHMVVRAAEKQSVPVEDVFTILTGDQIMIQKQEKPSAGFLIQQLFFGASFNRAPPAHLRVQR